jgi:short-subunit dehydrogenase
MLAAVRRQLGPIDILVNGAGVEFNSAYHELSEGQIGEVLSVNLEAPMILSRLVLPEMLERRQGHIVNISSLAGKSGPAFQEPYAATKAGLVALTQSLRATYRGTGVSASVIVPAFVEAGIYARLKAKSGCAAPALLTGCSPEQVAQAVLRSIEGDVPEIIVSRYPIRPVLALSVLSPRLGGWITARMGVNDFFRRAAEAEKRNRS